MKYTLICIIIAACALSAFYQWKVINASEDLRAVIKRVHFLKDTMQEYGIEAGPGMEDGDAERIYIKSTPKIEWLKWEGCTKDYRTIECPEAVYEIDDSLRYEIPTIRVIGKLTGTKNAYAAYISLPGDTEYPDECRADRRDFWSKASCKSIGGRLNGISTWDTLEYEIPLSEI